MVVKGGEPHRPKQVCALQGSIDSSRNSEHAHNKQVDILDFRVSTS